MTVRQAHPFDGFDRLPFDKLRVCDTAGRLRMTLSGVDWVRVPSGVEGQAIPIRIPPSPGLQRTGREHLSAVTSAKAEARSYNLHRDGLAIVIDP